jgi:hypothetical protein
MGTTQKEPRKYCLTLEKKSSIIKLHADNIAISLFCCYHYDSN